MTYYLGIQNFELVSCNEAWVPKFCTENLDKVKNMKMHKDDIIAASYPKAGTTWVQQIVYLICNGADVEEASKKQITEKFPFLEYRKKYEIIDETKPPRLIKTHLPFDLLSDEIRNGIGKVIYIARNPKDVLVSGYFFLQMLKFCDFKGTLQEVVDALLSEVDYSGPFWRNVLSYWKCRNDPNLLFITYEELKENLGNGIRRIARFLNKTVTEEQFKIIEMECRFETMKNNDTANYKKDSDMKPEYNFMRKGQVGDWKNHLTEEMSRSTDKYIEEKLAPHGIELTEQL